MRLNNFDTQKPNLENTQTILEHIVNSCFTKKRRPSAAYWLTEHQHLFSGIKPLPVRYHFDAVPATSKRVDDNGQGDHVDGTTTITTGWQEPNRSFSLTYGQLAVHKNSWRYSVLSGFLLLLVSPHLIHINLNIDKQTYLNTPSFSLIFCWQAHVSMRFCLRSQLPF